jgi:glycosyltransferase involved in cell wall biosynthesis
MTVQTFARDLEVVTAAVERTIADVAADALLDRAPWVRLQVLDSFADADDVGLAIAAGPGLFLLDALEAGVPVVVPMCDETRRYVRAGGGMLVPGRPDAIVDGVLRIVAMAPAARRVMGRIGRNHLLDLVG